MSALLCSPQNPRAGVDGWKLSLKQNMKYQDYVPALFVTFPKLHLPAGDFERRFKELPQKHTWSAPRVRRSYLFNDKVSRLSLILRKALRPTTCAQVRYQRLNHLAIFFLPHPLHGVIIPKQPSYVYMSPVLSGALDTGILKVWK